MWHKRRTARAVTLVALTFLVGCQLPPLSTQGDSDRPKNQKVQQVAPPPVDSRPMAEQIQGQFIVMLKGERIPKNFSASVREAGGTLIKTIDKIGVALVYSADPGYADRLAKHPAVEGVAANALVTIPETPGMAPGRTFTPAQAAAGPSLAGVARAPSSSSRGRRWSEEEDELSWNVDCDFDPEDHPFEPQFHVPPEPFGDPFDLTFQGPPDPSGPSGEPLSGYQWGLRTTRAAVAWCSGFTGEGVTVAILDTGIDPDNPDLSPNVDVQRSISFVDSEPTIIDFNGHGSHVGGIVAAAQNNFGVTGIAPNATLIGVKVLDQTLAGTVFNVLQGMVYSADAGADVLNMSLRTLTPTVEPANRTMFRRAILYVTQRGANIVSIAGNEMLDIDTFPGDVLPGELEPVIAVSAVGPEGQQNFDNFAFYSNFGSFVDIAAPGGNATFDPDADTVAFDKRDFVLSTFSTHAISRQQGAFTLGPATHAFELGTSMAGPHVAGAVAVLRQAFPRDNPQQIRQRLLRAADDIGRPGNDPFFGFGRLNVGNAVAGNRSGGRGRERAGQR